MPLGTSAPITGIGTDDVVSSGPHSVNETDGTGTVSYANYWAGTKMDFEEDPNNTGYPNIRADLTNAASATINELRQAFQIQKLLERDARSGTRYSEIVRSHFNVNFLDVTYRPEFLSGTSVPINITQVPQTSESGTTAQGTLAAFGTAQINSGGFTKSFTEHCIIMGIASVRS